MFRGRQLAWLVVGLVAVAPGGWLGSEALAAGAAGSSRHPVTVSPSTGHARTAFAVRFRAPLAAGPVASLNRHYWITASGPSRAGCDASRFVVISRARKGERERVVLRPRKGSGGWCKGTFHGRVVLVSTPICHPALACPAFVDMASTVGRFSFKVR
ncbi:MAG TPA: hypothetical protein VE992_07675 [Solirubrobacteraceae bacterium]|nr:hypothetical protein [Solirubrobacteraceae bacterium]